MLVSFRDRHNQPIAYLSVRLGKNEETVEQCAYGHLTDTAGNASFNMIASAPYYEDARSFTLYCNYNDVIPRLGRTAVTVPNFDTNHQVIVPWAGEDGDGAVFGGPLSTDGVRFVQAGKTWKYHSVTAFSLLADLITGKDMSGFLHWATVRANTVRVFSMWSQIGFDPRQIATYWDDYTRAVAYVKTFGLFMESVIFTDSHVLMHDQTERLAFYRRFCEFAQDQDNLLPSLVNENDVAINTIPVASFPRPSFLASSGSNGGDVDIVQPTWSWSEFHPGRSADWPRKVKSAREFADQTHTPCINNETNRPDLASYVVSDFKDCGYVSGLLTAGTNGHSTALKTCLIPQDAEAECVDAILDCSRFVDADVYLGRYTRGTVDGSGDCPMYHRDTVALRTFAIIDDAHNRAWAIIVRPTSDNPRRADHGWRIVGNRDNFYWLER